MSLANFFTITRIALIPIMMYLLLTKFPNHYEWAALVFSLGALTDYIDGYIARKYDQITNLGIFLDPLADKLLIMSALVCLVALQRVPAWTVIVILAREFAITGLRAIKAEEGVIVPANRGGKIKTVTQIIAILLVILVPFYQMYISYPVDVWAIYIATVATVASGVEYFIKAS